MDIDINVQGCPENIVAPVDRDVVFDSKSTTIDLHCGFAQRNVTITTVPPTADRSTPLVKCNLKENGTCPLLVSKEH